MENKIASLDKNIAKLRKQKQKYETEHSILKTKAEYVGCRKCGSRLKVSFLKSEKCPLCNTDLKSKAVMDKLKEFDVKILSLFNEKKDIEENALRNKKGTFDLNWGVEPKREVDKKIFEYLQNKYNGEFKYAECCEGKDYIFVSSKDFIHAKTYFSAWFDAFIFDKEGNLVYFSPRYIEGTAYSDFFVDRVECDNNIFKIILRSHIHSYSKCDDEFLAVWTFKFDETRKNYVLNKNPFVFNERRSERDISVCEDKFTNANGNYVVYPNKGKYSTLELSESWAVRRDLENELLKSRRY